LRQRISGTLHRQFGLGDEGRPFVFVQGYFD
jgi:hypothetical protein